MHPVSRVSVTAAYRQLIMPPLTGTTNSTQRLDSCTPERAALVLTYLEWRRSPARKWFTGSSQVYLGRRKSPAALVLTYLEWRSSPARTWCCRAHHGFTLGGGRVQPHSCLHTLSGGAVQPGRGAARSELTPPLHGAVAGGSGSSSHVSLQHLLEEQQGGRDGGGV